VPRAGLSSAAVTEVAIGLIDEHGADALTLAAVANRAGVAAPSLYKHVPSLAELRDRIAVRVLDELAQRLAAAVLGRSGEDALRAAMWAYRSFVVDHPKRYAAMPQQPSHNPQVAAAANRLLEVTVAVLRGYGMEGSAAIHAARSLRATAHGFASLQAAGGFGLPEDLDESYNHLIHMLAMGISQLGESP
jgi:AcrR family transcriptional regulator